MTISSKRAAFIAILAVLTAFLPATLTAQEGAEGPEAESGSTVVSAPPEAAESVVVEGSPMRYDCPDRGVNSCPVVDLSEGYHQNSLNMSEVMLGEPGVRVEKMGGEEGPWYPRVRGSDPQAASVYLDGILLNDPVGNPVDLSSLPVGLVDYVLVYNGNCPAEYPVAGPGVIDIKLFPPSKAESYTGRVFADTNNTYSGSLSITGEARGGAAVFATSQQAGTGRYEFTDDKGTYGTDDDDRREFRRNNDFQDHHLAGKYERRVGDVLVYGGGYYNYRFNRLPGKAHEDPEHAYRNSEMAIIYGGARQPGFLTPDLDAEVKVHYLSESATINDEESELGAPRYSTDKRWRAGADMDFHYYGIPRNLLSLYVGVYEDEYNPESRLDPQVDDISASRSSVYVNLADEISFFDGKLTVKPRARYLHEGNSYKGESLAVQQGEDIETTSHSALTADVSVSYLVYESLWILAHAGQYYRTPSFSEEFGDRSMLVGNENLDPQRTVIGEGGVLYNPGSFSMVDDLWVKVMFFQNRVYDRIGWEETGTGDLFADNIGDTRVTGVEISARLNLEDIILVEAAYSFQDPVNLSENDDYDGNQLVGVPRNTFYSGIIVRQSYGQIFYDFYYQDMRWLDPENQLDANPRLIHDVGAVYYRGKWSVGIKAANLGNAQQREVLGYPLPGTRYIIFTEVET